MQMRSELVYDSARSVRSLGFVYAILQYPFDPMVALFVRD